MYRYKNILSREEKKISETLRREISRLDPVVQPLALHVVEAGGKRIRPLMAVLMAAAFGCSNERVYETGCAIEFLHGASLMHDDVVDGAAVRRGSPSAHAVFGESRTILAGDVLLASCMRIVLRTHDFDVMESVAAAAERTAAGEVDEICNLRNPDMDYASYLRIITGKTAWLIRSACEVGALLAGASSEQVEAAARYGLEMGIAFQLVDDALDIAPEKKTGKPTGGDLREGKVTPLLHFYMESISAEERTAFAAGFASASLSDVELQGHISRMRELKCDERTRALADAHLKRAEEALAFVPEGQERKILYAMSDYIRDRDH
jgi:octaprenyl-diphosphate synthase